MKGLDHPQYRHGHAGRNPSPTYVSWRAMINRCRVHTSIQYPSYGGRGIKICDAWLRFENFLADMGERPRGMTLERINNHGNYEPGNCRWATRAEQNRNTRTTKLTVEAASDIRLRRKNGETLMAIAVDYGVSKSLVHAVTRGKSW